MMLKNINAGIFFLAALGYFTPVNSATTLVSVKAKCPFPVSEVVLMWIIPGHYPASILPDVAPDEGDESTGRIEWNNVYSASKSAPSVIAECTPQRADEQNKPDTVRISISMNVEKCVMEDVRKPAANFWCE
ncbi:hypothetical protein FCJ48_18235 [Salmonella enterica]|nr:hypothetical protein [Salmonella enterica]